MNRNHTAGALMIAALFIAALNLRPAINSIAPVLESIRIDMEMNAAVASLLTSIPVLCMGLFSPIAAKFGARWGIERIIGWSLALIGLGTILRLFTGSATFLLITAVMAGIGIAAVGPLLSGFIKRHFPSNVPAMIAVYTMALTIGAALASGLSVPLESGTRSWQIALASWALLAIIAAPVWLGFVRRRADVQAGTPGSPQSAKLPWGNKKAWLLTIHFGLMAMGFYSVTAWLPPIMENIGYTKLYAGTLLTIFAIFQIPAGLFLQKMLKHFPSRLLWLLVASLMQLAGYLLLLIPALPWLAAVLIGFGAGTLFALSLMLPIDATTNAQEAASWAAMTQSAGYVIGALGPFLIGWINDATGSFSLAITGLILITLLMMTFQVAIAPKKHLAASAGTVSPGSKH